MTQASRWAGMVAAALVSSFGCGSTPPTAASGPGPVIVGDSALPAATGGEGVPGVEPGEPGGSPAPTRLPPAAQAILDTHNRLRAKHCAPPLAWSAAVAAVAQAWADQLLDAGCAFEHSRSNRYGENLFFYGPAGGTTGAAAVEDWYSEVKSYDFGHAGFAMDTGHFTQVVWRGTTEVGCGMARCSGGDIWVCNYDPPGNVLTQFESNVLPTSCR